MPPSTQMPTPIKPDRLQYHLQNIKYNDVTTTFLVNGFKNGFSIGNTSEVEDIEALN